jgi:hypothetical protein
MRGVARMARPAGWLRAAAIVCACVTGGLSLPADAAAQAGRFELSGAAGWAGETALGSEQATLTGNGVPTGSPLVYFDADSTLGSGATFDGRLAWLLGRTFAIEGSAGVTRSELRTRITADVEGADPVTVTERVNQFTIEGGLLVHLRRLAFAGGRALPFVAGGGGYLRQLHDGETLATDGGSGYVGGGLKYGLRERPRGWAKGFGLRADLRVRLHKGGFDLGDRKLRAHPSVTGGLYLRF